MKKIGIDSLVTFDLNESDSDESLTPLEKCVRGQPVQRTWNLFSSDDDHCFSGVWEAEPGCWKISYTEHEYCRILSGRSILRDSAGVEKQLEPGCEFLIPAGFEGEWDVLETTRKVYVIYQP